MLEWREACVNALSALKSYKCLLQSVEVQVVVIGSVWGQEEQGASENVGRGQ